MVVIEVVSYGFKRGIGVNIDLVEDESGRLD